MTTKGRASLCTQHKSVAGMQISYSGVGMPSGCHLALLCLSSKCPPSCPVLVCVCKTHHAGSSPRISHDPSNPVVGTHDNSKANACQKLRSYQTRWEVWKSGIYLFSPEMELARSKHRQQMDQSPSHTEGCPMPQQLPKSTNRKD